MGLDSNLMVAMGLFWFAIFALCSLSVSATEFCKLDTKACNCIGSDGWGIDLRNISGKSFSSSATPASSSLLSFCQDSHDPPEWVNGTKDCKEKGYALCDISAAYNSTANVTTYNSHVLMVNKDWPPMIKEANESSLKISLLELASIRLVCVKDQEDQRLVADSTRRTLTLYTPAACLAMLRPPPSVEGLGTGAILSILILVTFFSYCSLGILYNNFVRGMRGVELVPNLDFWRSLPGLVMDGIRFIQNGCRPSSHSDMGSSGGRETYDSI